MKTSFVLLALLGIALCTYGKLCGILYQKCMGIIIQWALLPTHDP